MQRHLYLREDRVSSMFHDFLDAHDGKDISPESLMAHGFDAEITAEVFSAADLNHDGRIDRSEFEILLYNGTLYNPSSSLSCAELSEISTPTTRAP
jgi:hypothetical protein